MNNSKETQEASTTNEQSNNNWQQALKHVFAGEWELLREDFRKGIRQDISKFVRNMLWAVLGALVFWLGLVLFNIDIRELTMDNLMPKSEYTIEGEVTDKYGQPVPDAIVMVVGEPDTARTNSAGEYEMRVKLPRSVETISMTCGKDPVFQPTEKNNIDIFKGVVCKTSFILHRNVLGQLSAYPILLDDCNQKEHFVSFF